jgi:RsiW-degrading membrane proteinase PrsW (M82 family)
VLRLQGFVAGALLITAIDLLRRFLFSKDPEAAQALATAWATALIAATVYAAIVAAIDRYEREPWHMLLVGLLWGTVVSGAIAGLFNRALGEFLDVRSASVAPYVEELAKGAVLFLIFFTSYEFNDALDGIIYGAMVGIGFAMAENAGYFYHRDRSTDILEQMRTGQFFLRVVLKGLAGHATYTGLTGLGLGLGKQARKKWLRIALPALGLTVAIVAHVLWNSKTLRQLLDLSAIESGPWRAAARVALINGPFFAGVVTAVILSWRKEAKVIAEQLAGELDAGAEYVTPDSMRTPRARLSARWRALRSEGLSAWWAVRQLQTTWIDLAFCKWHGEDETPFREHIRVLSERLST